MKSAGSVKNDPNIIPKQRAWLEKIQFFLLRADGVSYALFLHQVIVELTFNIYAIGSIAGILMRADGAIVMKLHWPSMSVFEVPTAAEVLKHEVLHVIMGHTSSRGDKLFKKYGRQITGIAMDLVVNQYCDVSLFKKAGISPVTIEDFGFEPNLTTEEYCQRLLEKAMANKSGEGMPLEIPKELAEELGLPPDGSLDPRGKPCKDGQPLKGVWDVFGEVGTDGESTEIDPAVKDIRVEKVLTRVREAMESRDDIGGSGRGWEAAEALEWVEQVKGPPKIPWYSYLRRLESKHLRADRELTKKRPSRRDPTHFGRIRRYGLYIWCAVDTSGSMQGELARVQRECDGMVNRGAVLDIYHVDSAVAKVERYDRRVGLSKFAGRGGTDFSPIFQELAQTPPEERPAFIVYITDGYGCLTQYQQDFNGRYGEGAYEEVTDPRKMKCPDGVDSLWLLPEGNMDPENFANVAPFGMISLLPS